MDLFLRSRCSDLALLLILLLLIKHGNSFFVHDSKDMLLCDAFVLVCLHHELCRLLYKVTLHLQAQHRCIEKASAQPAAQVELLQLRSRGLLAANRQATPCTALYKQLHSDSGAGATMLPKSRIHLNP